jgi:hypothetical protein
MAEQRNPIGINLLHDRKVEVKKRKLLLAKIQTVTGVVLAVFIGLGVLIGGARAASSLQVSRLEDTIAQEEGRIAQLKPVESLYTTVTSKFEAYDEIYANRIQVPQVFELLLKFVPIGVTVNEITIEPIDALTTSVVYSTTSLYEAQALLTSFQNEVASERVEFVSVDSLGRSETGAYQVEVLMTGL